MTLNFVLIKYLKLLNICAYRLYILNYLLTIEG